VHTQPYYENMGFKKGDYPNAESYYKSVISIPIFQGLTIEMQDEVINVLKKVLA
jgi:dTDP-4-amino-4,6-dideoxygalactose transaminase